MSWSATEIATLATKAARGGGAPPEQALRFGTVAAEHLMSGRDPAVLASALKALPFGPILTCPRIIDAALSVGDGSQNVLRGMPRGDLMLGYAETLPFDASLEVSGNGEARLNVEQGTPRVHRNPRRITGCLDLIDQMTVLAENTLVPESEGSRLSGAGAGLTDND